MAATSSLPVWILDSKEEITKSWEWPSFLHDLYDAIQQQLNESHVESFSNLTEAEKTLFMERAMIRIRGGTSYNDLYKKVANSLDRQLNDEVGRQMKEDQATDTRTDLILDTAEDGIVGLLRKWPDMKSKLHVSLNQPLSESMRSIVWKLFLENSKVRAKYMRTLAENPRSAVSSLDYEITQKCQELLRSDATLIEVKNSVGAFFAMKAVLSYYHAVHGGRDPLPDSYFNLIIPLLLVSAPNLPRKEPAPGQIVAVLTEEYFSFLSSLPTFVTECISQLTDKQVRIFAGRVAHHLRQISSESATAIVDAFLPATRDPGGEDSTDVGKKEILTDAVTVLFKPIIRNMFVGHVNKDVLLYIWDQYIIGLDSPGFSDDYLPIVTAVYLKLLAEKLRGCTSAARMEICLKTDGVKLTTKQFQYEIHKHFFLELSRHLNRDDRSAQPVVDPTQAVYPPWQNWFADQRTTSHTTAADRRAARDEREAERQRQLQRKTDELRRQRIEDEERYREQQAEYQRRNDDDRKHLQELLDEERRKANEEIEQLRKQLNELQREQQMRLSLDDRETLVSARSTGYGETTTARSVSEYLLPARPTANDVQTPRVPPTLRAPPPNTPPDLQSHNVIEDYLQKIVYSFNKVAHGEGHQRQRLNEKTFDSIRVHGDDVRKAEIAVLGRELRGGEFESLPQSERERMSEEIMSYVRQLIQERRHNEFIY